MKSDPSTGVDLQNLKVGDALDFQVDATCQLASCGTATLKVTLPAGLKVLQLQPIPATWTIASDDTSVTLTLDDLPGSGASYMFAAVVAADAAVGTYTEQATADLATSAGGLGGVPNQLTSTNTVTLNIAEQAAVDVTSGLTGSPVTNPGDSLSYWVTGTQHANYTGSSLTFATTQGPAADVALFDAFDLDSLNFSSNPNGATVTFEVGGVAQAPIPVGAGTTTVTVPSGVTNYTVVFNDVATGTAITVTAGLLLRDTIRGGSDPVVTAGAGHVMADATTTVTSDTFGNSQGGQPSTASKVATQNPQINAPAMTLPAVTIDWTTASGDNVSIYGSGDQATMTTKAANVSDTTLTSLTIQMPQDPSVLIYEAVTGAPTIKCPANASTYTVTYSYGIDSTTGKPMATGSPQVANCSVSTGPAVDSGYSWDQVTQVTVTFNGTIAAQCAAADVDSCGAIVKLPTKLRDFKLDGDAVSSTRIGPPTAGEPVARPLLVNPLVSVVANSGATGSTSTAQGELWLEVPNYQVVGTKTIGAPMINSALTGLASAGDWVQDGLQNHELTFTVTAQSANPAKSVVSDAADDTDTSYGPTTLVLSDPSSLLSSTSNDVPQRNINAYMNSLNKYATTEFFSYAQMMTVPSASNVSCVTGTGTVLTSADFSVTIDAYYYDPIIGVLSARLGVDPDPDADAIVGLVYQINAASGTRFPVGTQCTIDAGPVRWRDYRLADKLPVNLNYTPSGLLTVTNNAQARSEEFPIASAVSGYYQDASPSATFALGDQSVGYGAKSYGTTPGIPLAATSPAATQIGIENQQTPTSFILGGSVASRTEATAIQYQDGDYTTAGDSFDVFALTGLRGAYVGPDQVMTVTLFDKTGATLYTVDISAPSTCTSTPCPADNDSQSADYQAAFQAGLTWSAGSQTYVWKDAGGNVLATQPTAADLFDVAQLIWVVTRTNSSDFLPQYAAARLVIDVTLRSVTLMNLQPIVGKRYNQANPTYLYNKATTYVEENGDFSTKANPTARFLVLSPAQTNLNAFIDWQSNVTGLPTDPNGVLVAGTGTVSTITVRAYNDTAIDIGYCPESTTPVDPADIWWQCPTSLGQGVGSLVASVGGIFTNHDTQNPFNLVDFVNINSIKAPKTQAGADVVATITYLYFDGTTEQQSITLPSGGSSSDPSLMASLMPADPGDVVGVQVSFEAVDHSLITTHDAEPNGNHDPSLAQSSLTFTTVLRDNARADTDFATGDSPASISAGDLIAGPDDPAKSQTATAWVSVQSFINGDPQASIVDANSATLPLVKALNSATLTKTSTSESDAGSGTVINRDAANSRATFTITANNTSNHPVDRMVIADRDCLLNSYDPATGIPAAGPTTMACSVTPDSVFDSFNPSSIIVNFPQSVAATANLFDLTAWYLMDDGTWQPWTTVGTSTHFTAGASGSPGLPSGYTWAQVLGVILVLQGFDNTPTDGIDNPSRISYSVPGTSDATRGQMTVTMTTTLRQYLRSNPAVRAPGDTLPTGSDHWTVTNTATAAMYMAGMSNQQRTWALAWTATDPVSSAVWVRPGTPDPQAFMQVAQSGSLSLADSQYIYPGNWADFYAGFTNQPDATGSIYNASFTVTVPDGMHYNETGGHSYAQVTSLTGYTLAGNAVTCSWADDATKTQLVCTVDGYLMPGESVMVKLPLQLNDGAPAGTYTANNQIMAGGLDPSYVPPCWTTVLQQNMAQCTAHATVMASNYAGVRAEKYVAQGTQGIAGTNCDQSSLASWTNAQAVPSFYRDPCRAEITPGETVTYRVKLINSGNSDMNALRFVDVLPYTNDDATLAALARGSQFDTSYVVGSLRLVDGLTFRASDPDANLYRGDGQLTAQYSTSTNPCVATDASAGANVLACTAGNWTSTASTATASLKGDITFSTPLTGGQYVIIEYQVKAASANADGSKMVSGELINNDIAVAGADATGWRGASSSPMVTAELLIKPSANASTGGSLTGEGDISGALLSVLLGLSAVGVIIRRRRPTQ